MIVGLFIGMFVSNLVNSSYELLNSKIPDYFPIYNAISEQELHTKQQYMLNLIALAITLLVTIVISLVYNNERYEFIVSKTDGFYRVHKVIKLYIKRFVLADIIASILIGLIFTIPITFINSAFFSVPKIYSEIILILHIAHKALGTAGFCIFVPSVMILLHIPAIPIALNRWRAKWLTGFADDR